MLSWRGVVYLYPFFFNSNASPLPVSQFFSYPVGLPSFQNEIIFIACALSPASALKVTFLVSRGFFFF